MKKKMLFGNQPLTRFTTENFAKYFAYFLFCEKSKLYILFVAKVDK